jgi:Tol biopolymer transport system component
VALLLLPGATYGGNYVPPAGDALPVWSPDGSRIAYLTTRGGLALVTVSADGSGEARILEGYGSPGGPYPDPTVLALSPDWRWVAALRHTGSRFVLVAVRLDGSEERELAPSAYLARPAWSPDSRRVVFTSSDGALAVVGLDGSGFARFATAGLAPSWSPDGTRIAYQGGVPGNPDVHVVGADGQGDVLVAGGPGGQGEPKWSPDGASIAFLTQSAVGENFALAVSRPDGSGLRTYPGQRSATRTGSRGRRMGAGSSLRAARPRGSSASISQRAWLGG